jgi:hypothetical protein
MDVSIWEAARRRDDGVRGETPAPAPLRRRACRSAPDGFGNCRSGQLQSGRD